MRNSFELQIKRANKTSPYRYQTTDGSNAKGLKLRHKRLLILVLIFQQTFNHIVRILFYVLVRSKYGHPV